MGNAARKLETESEWIAMRSLLDGDELGPGSNRGAPATRREGAASAGGEVVPLSSRASSPQSSRGSVRVGASSPTSRETFFSSAPPPSGIELDRSVPASLEPKSWRGRQLASIFDVDVDEPPPTERSPVSRSFVAAIPASRPMQREDSLKAVAGFGPAPEGLFESPLYVLRVLERQKALKSQAAHALASDRPFLLEPTKTYDAVAFRKGLAVWISGAALGVLAIAAMAAGLARTPVAEQPAFDVDSAQAEPPAP